MRGLVVKSTGSWYEVRTDEGTIVPCRLRGQFRIKGIKNTNPVVVGDHVTFLIEQDGNGYITDIEQRKNYIDRKSTKLSKISHLIAANIDMAFLVVTLVFNKMDLYAPDELARVDEIENIYRSVGYATLRTSTVTGEGIKEMYALMSGKVSLFSGHSGVGKSALVNCIDPSLQVKIGEISGVHKKGKHTTTFAQMYPLQNGGYIIDTPGLKEFGLIQYSKEEIRDYFPEIRQYNNSCRFDNCLHVHEPDCAVIKAVEAGKIPASRYANYLALLQDKDIQIEDWKLR